MDDSELLARLDERVQALQSRVEQSELHLTTKVEGFRREYQQAHLSLVEKVDAVSNQVSSVTGSTSAATRLWTVAAVGIAFIVMIGGIVDLLTRH